PHHDRPPAHSSLHIPAKPTDKARARKKTEGYCDDNLAGAVAALASGCSWTAVRDALPSVLERTRTRPPPVLPQEVDEDTSAWTVGTQMAGLPVTHKMVLVKANKAYHALYIPTRFACFLGEWWLQRFPCRQPHLSLLVPQMISSARNQVRCCCPRSRLWRLRQVPGSQRCSQSPKTLESDLPVPACVQSRRRNCVQGRARMLLLV
ncbi:hypothetical protein PybrP1_005443, partial [[Pythium] brassicae (nom. inval.)]